jgi:hypothetical protein
MPSAFTDVRLGPLIGRGAYGRVRRRRRRHARLALLPHLADLLPLHASRLRRPRRPPCSLWHPPPRLQHELSPRTALRRARTAGVPRQLERYHRGGEGDGDERAFGGRSLGTGSRWAWGRCWRRGCFFCLS